MWRFFEESESGAFHFNLRAFSFSPHPTPLNYLPPWHPLPFIMFHKSAFLIATSVILSCLNTSSAFQVVPRPYISPFAIAPTTATCSSSISTKHAVARRALPPLHAKNVDKEERSVTPDSVDLWNPTVRKIIAGISTVGLIETGYLSYIKLYVPDGIKNLCGGDSPASCSSVLNGPYGHINIGDTEIPLTVFGFAAYSTVALLSALPILNGDNDNNNENENNRIAILGVTTAMATFSSFLLSLLFNTLHLSCPYCLLSAALSISMGFLAWTSGALPINRSQDGVKLGLGSFLTTTIASLAFFFSVDEAAMQVYSNDIMQANGLTSNVVARADAPTKDIPPPPVTAVSSERSLKIGQDLKSLDAKMFGAYWCSHCYEQKQRLGKEAFANVQYMECSKEGLNSKVDMCKERKVPGYPTWEINGKLFPGDMYLDELEDIIKDERKTL